MKYIILDVSIAYYTLTKTIIADELILYEDKLAKNYQKRWRYIQPYMVV